MNTVGNCTTMVSIIILVLCYNIIILWDHRRIYGPSLTETSLCGAYLYLKQWRCLAKKNFTTVFTGANHCSLFWTRLIQSTISHIIISPILLQIPLINGPLSFWLSKKLHISHFPLRVLRVMLIFFFFSWWPSQYQVINNLRTTLFIFSALLQLSLFYTKIFSASFTKHPLHIHVFKLAWNTKFCTHTIIRVNVIWS